MRINHNIAALNTHRQLTSNTAGASKSLEKLSSGLRINRAGDDAAGLAISEKMRAQIRGLDMAAKNAQDGISLIQTAEGALNETHSILQRMRELADQSANGTNTAEDRKNLQDEVVQLKQEVDRIGNNTEFNTQKLLNGSLKSSGALVGQNGTTGSIIAKQTAGTVEAGAAISSGDITDAMFVEETITIDGTEIKVNWANLSTDDKAFLKAVDTTDLGAAAKATNIIVNAINSAIDASGKNVSHVKGYTDNAGVITLQSGSKGVDSKFSLDSGAAGVLNQMYGAATPADGESTYNGADTANAADLRIGNVLLEVDLAGVATSGDDMSEVADALQTAINDAIAAYNGITNKADGEEGFIKDVTVTVTNDGRLSINSESGPVTLQDRYGNTDVSDLGLSNAQTEAAGNGGMTFQIGANRGQTITFGIGDMRSAALGIAGVDISTATSASAALDQLDKAITSVSSERSKMGAVQNRLEHTINNLQTASENLTAAESRIRDVDMAKEMMDFTKNNILSQAAQAMLAQANQQPQGVLQLLR
ncbi:flagellin [Paenibacillus daejeonensis]|uniref:flagellin N-terminal helical domain-containing protein n=1 Tax=Paenibacillus daejeonensis TaxID=135193 RepID=UPI00037464D0|nr:flagellin [Paenibacillus daejeonensis]